jgi:hypothetical protein
VCEVLGMCVEGVKKSVTENQADAVTVYNTSSMDENRRKKIRAMAILNENFDILNEEF